MNVDNIAHKYAIYYAKARNLGWDEDANENVALGCCNPMNVKIQTHEV